MTVNELIKELEKMGGDKIVKIINYDYASQCSYEEKAMIVAEKDNEIIIG